MTTRRHLASVTALVLAACTAKAGDIGSLPGDGGAEDDSAGTSSGGDDGGSGGPGNSEDGDGGSSDGDPDTPPADCSDIDGDDVPLAEDNAPNHFNPLQLDSDGDDVGDVVDLCPLVAGDASNTADSDKDGVGNACDSCRQTASQYNKDEATPPAYMLVRNNPFQQDSDEDGIGDACDNCVLLPNCEDYGPGNPHGLGDPIAYDDDTQCNTDANNDMVGDACEASFGLGPEDDFDGDGLANVRDACPRIYNLELISCDNDGDCPANRRCEIEDGWCDHADFDADGVGDVCDTCPAHANPSQVMDGVAQEDDEDGDFVGAACESGELCSTRSDARPMSFFEYSAAGQCCTVELVAGDGGDLSRMATGAVVRDPDGRPLRVECSATEEESGVCRRLPSVVAATPGVLELPPGCAEVLGSLGPDENPRLVLDDVGGDIDELWGFRCALPPFDQDFDGLGDVCDFCPLAFDPLNEPFIDANGMVWPSDGRYCNGEYAPTCD